MRRFFFCLLLLGTLCSALPTSAFCATTENPAIEAIAREISARLQEPATLPLEGFSFICAYGSEEDVRKALAAGADPNAFGGLHGPVPPLFIAAGANPDPGAVRALLAAGADIHYIEDNFGRTALHQAMLFNTNAVPVLQELFAGTPDMYVMDIDRNTVFNYAVKGTARTIHDSYDLIFTGVPRNEVLLLLLEASEKLPYAGQVFPKGAVQREEFFSTLLIQYAWAFRDKNAIPPVMLDAFEKAGAPEEEVAKVRESMQTR